MRPALSPALILFAAITVLSVMDATIKYLTETNHVLVVVLGRYFVGAIFAFAIWAHAERPAITPDMWRAHGLRGFVVATSATSFFWSLTVLPLAEAVALSFFYPLIVPFVAAAMIGERVRGSSLVAALLGFSGVIVTMQGAPDTAESPLYYWGVGAVILAATTFAVSIVLMRQRARTDGPAIVGVMASLIPGLIVLGPALVIATPPQIADWPIFLFLGLLATAGMYLMARAYAGAEAQQLAPIHYSELFWAALIGYFVFHEIPRPQVLIGAGVIIAACLFAAWDERRLSVRVKHDGV